MLEDLGHCPCNLVYVHVHVRVHVSYCEPEPTNDRMKPVVGTAVDLNVIRRTANGEKLNLMSEQRHRLLALNKKALIFHCVT